MEGTWVDRVGVARDIGFGVEYEAGSLVPALHLQKVPSCLRVPLPSHLQLLAMLGPLWPCYEFPKGVEKGNGSKCFLPRTKTGNW